MGGNDNLKPEDPKVAKDPEVKTDPPAVIGLSAEDRKIIEEIAEDSEVVPEVPAADGISVPGKDPAGPDIVTTETASILALAIVQSVDTGLNVVGKIIAKRSDMDFHMPEKDKKGLIDVWTPVCKKWGDKIPIEVIALLTTISVCGSCVGYAIKSRIPEEKKK